MTADSVPRQPICRFYYFPNPPFRLSFHPCVSRCTGVCSVGSFAERGSSEWSRVRSAACSVARVCQLTPFRSRTTLCRLSLLHHRGRWVSLTYHAILVWGPRFGVSLRLQMQEEPTPTPPREALDASVCYCYYYDSDPTTHGPAFTAYIPWRCHRRRWS